MKTRSWMSFVCLLAAFGLAGACGSKGSGAGGSYNGPPVDNSCKAGGQACTEFGECCSGTCANQISACKTTFQDQTYDQTCADCVNPELSGGCTSAANTCSAN